MDQKASNKKNHKYFLVEHPVNCHNGSAEIEQTGGGHQRFCSVNAKLFPLADSAHFRQSHSDDLDKVHSHTFPQGIVNIGLRPRWHSQIT